MSQALCRQLCSHRLSGSTELQVAPQECGFTEEEKDLGRQRDFMLIKVTELNSGPRHP